MLIGCENDCMCVCGVASWVQPSQLTFYAFFTIKLKTVIADSNICIEICIYS